MTFDKRLKVETVFKSKNESPIREQIKTERKRTPNEALTDEQVKKLLDGCTDLTDRTLLVLGFNTGMRVSEITNIEISLIDWEGEFFTVYDKKKRRFRKVYPGKTAMSALKIYINERNIKGPKIFDFSEKTTERKFQSLTEKILGDKRSWHTVRHTYVTECARKKIDLKIITTNTGDSVATIQKTYNNPSPQDMRENSLEIGS